MKDAFDEKPNLEAVFEIEIVLSFINMDADFSIRFLLINTLSVSFVIAENKRWK